MVPSKSRQPNSPKVQETEFPAGVQGQSPCPTASPTRPCPWSWTPPSSPGRMRAPATSCAADRSPS